MFIFATFFGFFLAILGTGINGSGMFTDKSNLIITMSYALGAACYTASFLLLRYGLS